MTIPVVWLNYHPEICNSPGMWDQWVVQEALYGLVFQPQRSYQFTNYHATPAGMDWPDAHGIILIVPGRFHEFEPRRISQDIAKYSWVLQIVTSDEERLYPWWKVRHPRIMTWVQTPKLAEDASAENRFGYGAPPGTNQILGGWSLPKQDIDVFFSGQVTHSRRESLMAANWSGFSDIFMNPTPGFTQGFDKQRYLRYMARSVVAPAPAGPQTVDSFRLWEAIEAGAVPLADTHTPTVDQTGYWSQINQRSMERLPFPLVDDWSDGPAAAEEVLRAPVQHANLCGSWLLRHKREFALRLHADIETMHGEGRPEPTADDQITVLMPSSYITSHPDTDIWFETLGSIRSHLPYAEILVMMDGNSGNPDYLEYQRRVLNWAKHSSTNLSVKIFTQPMHQTGMTAWALENFVRTEYILFVEHDTPLTIRMEQRIPFDDLLVAMKAGRLDYLRLHYQTQIHPEHLHLMHNGGEVLNIANVPVIRTVQWSQRPHISPADRYRSMLARYATDRNTFIEEIMHGVAQDHPNEFRMCIYAPPGNMERSYHLDGRKADQ